MCAVRRDAGEEEALSMRHLRHQRGHTGMLGRALLVASIAWGMSV